MTPLPANPADLRVAIIGAGRMGMRHVQAAQQLGMPICGLADRSEKTLEAAQSTHGIARESCFVDTRQMLASVKPSAVVVATTAPTHAPFVIAAAEAGARYVLCEKPMASSLAEADAMLDACTAAGTSIAVNHQMQFMPQYTEVKQLLGTPALGPLSSIIVAGGNFGLAMNGSHYFEMFRYIVGEPVAAVQAWLEDSELANPRGPEFRDRSGRLVAWSDSGRSMYLEFAGASGHGMLVVYNCRSGQIVVDELDGDLRMATRKIEHRELPTTRYGMPADVQRTTIAAVDAVTPTMAVWSAVLEGHPHPDGAAGLHALKCLVAAHVSHEQGGRKVRLDDPALPRDRAFAWA